MKPNIVERLREFLSDPVDSPALNQAADEIERLREAKRRWSSVADKRATQVAELRAALNGVVEAAKFTTNLPEPFVGAIDKARAALQRHGE
jgi:hypothetical protein